MCIRDRGYTSCESAELFLNGKSYGRKAVSYTHLPSAISESAKMDGANDLVIFIRLILPLSKPLLATLSLFSALAYWNDWYNCMLYITNENMFTLQYYLQRMLGSAEAMRIVAEKSGMRCV